VTRWLAWTCSTHFPDNPHFAHANGVSNLAASFEKVLHEGHGHTMPLQRYDIRPEGRPWEVRFWHPKNWPIFDDEGSIVALVQHVTDVTASILSPKADPNASVRVERNILTFRTGRHGLAGRQNSNFGTWQR